MGGVNRTAFVSEAHVDGPEYSASHNYWIPSSKWQLFSYMNVMNGPSPFGSELPEVRHRCAQCCEPDMVVLSASM